MRPKGIPIMHTRALGHAFLMPPGTPPSRTMGQETVYVKREEIEQTKPLTPEAAAAFDAQKEAKRLYMATRARYDDLVLLVGKLKADEAVGQAATNAENAKAAYQDALSKGA